jgi:hypothetical protein
MTPHMIDTRARSISDKESRRLPVPMIQQFVDFPYHLPSFFTENSTEVCIGDMESHSLSVSVSSRLDISSILGVDLLNF